MRFLERTAKRLRIAPGLTATDALGGVRREFSPERIPVRAAWIPRDGGAEAAEPGRLPNRRAVALMPLDAPIAEGDGVCEGDGAPEWLCVSVQRWSAHLAAELERRVEARD